MNRADTVLEIDVMEELDWDPALDNSRLVVKVNDGRVTLSGVVHTSFDSVRAGSSLLPKRGGIAMRQASKKFTR
jgi:osmotically-inducible protein OsmY